MKKLVSILKASMAGGLQLFNYRGKTERSRRIMPLVLGALIFLSMLTSASPLAVALKQDGNGTILLSLYTIVTSVIILMEGIYKSGDLLFKPKDNDLLLSMPIKKSTIILSRIIKFYIFELIYCLIFLFPGIIAYGTNFETTALYPLIAFTMLLFVPIIPIAVSCFIGLISSAISSRFKHKTFFQVVLSFAFLIALSIIVLLAGNDGRTIVAVSDRMSAYYYPANVFVGLVNDFSLWQYLLFIGINFAVIIGTTLIIGRFYSRIVSRLGATKEVTSLVGSYRLTRHTQTFAMIKKEITKYFNTPVLLVNTMMGLILFLVAVVVLCLKYDDFIGSLTGSVEGFPLTAEQIYALMPSVAFGLIAFASLMTYITATSISLEGKAFNLLKTLPISGRKVIMSKVWAAMLLMVPITLLGGAIMAIRFQFGILEVLLMLVAAIIMPLVTELIGILIDLKYARFNAETDAVVVKQSAGVMIATFLGLGLLLLTISLLFGLVLVAEQIPGLLMMNAIFIILALFLYFVISTHGEVKYRKLFS